MPNTPPPQRGDLALVAVGDAFIARLEDVYPIVARLAPGAGGWSVSLVGASFTTHVAPVASELASLDAAKQAAGIALETVRALEERDAYRFLRRAGSVNRWYTDSTARQSVAWNGTLPDLRGAGNVMPGALDAALGYLDATFPHLVNLAQHRPHYDPARGRTTDPNEHTIEVLAGLDTAALSEEDML
ncbi:MAG TPA: hypothetical protein VGP33_06355, partial [Chloroflexota bacterium]|nr:hypothetical protein [Chloroflexota bacterium]